MNNRSTPVVLLGDGAMFGAVEREFYCEPCGDFRDVRENQNDVVCESCHSIVATFRDREIIPPTKVSA